MSTKLDKLVKELHRIVPDKQPVCIHFPDEMKEQGFRALDRYGFVLNTGGSLVGNPCLNEGNWFCIRTKSKFISGEGRFVTFITEGYMKSHPGRYKTKIRAEEYLLNNFRRN